MAKPLNYFHEVHCINKDSEVPERKQSTVRFLKVSELKVTVSTADFKVLFYICFVGAQISFAQVENKVFQIQLYFINLWIEQIKPRFHIKSR